MITDDQLGEGLDQIVNDSYIVRGACHAELFPQKSAQYLMEDSKGYKYE
jgi:hypothetical protein